MCDFEIGNNIKIQRWVGDSSYLYNYLNYVAQLYPLLNLSNVDIENYAQKLIANSVILCGSLTISNTAQGMDDSSYYWDTNCEGAKLLLGVIAFYVNDIENRIAFLSHISVLTEYQKMGIGSLMLDNAERAACDEGMKRMRLEVREDNDKAICFYTNMGYRKKFYKSGSVFMEKKIRNQ